MGVSLNGGTPKTPQNDHFYWENQWLLGTPILGNTHMNHNSTKQVGWLEWYLGSGDLHGWWNHPNVGRVSEIVVAVVGVAVLMVWGVERWWWWWWWWYTPTKPSCIIKLVVWLGNRLKPIRTASNNIVCRCVFTTLCPHTESTCKTQLSPPFSIPYLETTNSSPRTYPPFKLQTHHNSKTITSCYITTPLMGGDVKMFQYILTSVNHRVSKIEKKIKKDVQNQKSLIFFKGQTSKCNITFWRLYPCFLQQGVKMYYYIFTLGPCWRRKKVILHFDVVLSLRRIEGAKKGKNVTKIVFRRKNWQNPQKWQTRAESYKK